MAFVNVDAAQLHRLLQRVDEDSRRMTVLENRVAQFETERSASVAPPSHVSTRRAVSPPVPRGPTLSGGRDDHHVATVANHGAPTYHFGPYGYQPPPASGATSVASSSLVAVYHSPSPDAFSNQQPYYSSVRPTQQDPIRERDELIMMLRNELSENVKEMNALKKERDDIRLEMQRKVDALDFQVKSLVDAIDITTADDTGAGPSPSKLYQHQLREKNELIKTLSDELDLLRGQSAKLMEDTMAAVADEVATVTQKAAVADESHRRDKAQLEELVAIKQGQVAQLEGRLQSRDARVRELEEAQRLLSAQLHGAEARVAEAERDSERLRGDVAVARERLDHLDSFCETLKEDLVKATRRLSSEASANSALQAERDKALSAAAAVERKLDEAIKLLENERAASKGFWKDVREANEKHLAASNKCEELRSEVAKLQVEAEVHRNDALRSREDLKEAYQLVDSLRKEKMEFERSKVERAVADKQQSVSRSRLSVSSSLQSAESSVALLEEKLSTAVFTKDIQARELSALRKQLESVTADLEAAQNELSQSRRADAVSTLKVLRDENAGLRQEVARLSVEWEKARDEVLRLQQRLRIVTGRGAT